MFLLTKGYPASWKYMTSVVGRVKQVHLYHVSQHSLDFHHSALMAHYQLRFCAENSNSDKKNVRANFNIKTLIIK